MHEEQLLARLGKSSMSGARMPAETTVNWRLHLPCDDRPNAPTLNRAEVPRGSGTAVLLAQARKWNREP